MSNVLFTICGRAGSKGCKNKNIREFLGKPLFEYTIKAIREFNKIYNTNYQISVSTDSPEFIEMVEANHKDIFVINRSKKLAGDTVGKVEVIKDENDHIDRDVQELLSRTDQGMVIVER